MLMNASLDSENRPEKGVSGVDFAQAAAREMSDLHCSDVLVFDVRGLSQLTNYIVIGSPTT